MRVIIHINTGDKARISGFLQHIAERIAGGVSNGHIASGPDDRAAYHVDRAEDARPDRSATAPSGRKFYRHLYAVEVLSEESLEERDPGLAAIASMIDDGPCSGQVDLVDTEELDGSSAACALEAQASDPGFFGLTDLGQDLPWVAAVRIGRVRDKDPDAYRGDG